MGNIYGVSSSFSSSSLSKQTAVSAKATQLKQDAQQLNLSDKVLNPIKKVLDGVSSLDSATTSGEFNSIASKVIESFYTFMQQAQEVDPTFLEDNVEDAYKFKGKNRIGMMLESRLEATLKRIIPGQSLSHTHSGKTRSFLQGIMESLGIEVNKEEAEAQIRALLSNGIEDLGELMEILALVTSLGLSISVDLLSEIKEKIEEFVDDMASMATDIVDFMNFLEMVQEMVSAVMPDDLIDEEEILSQNFADEIQKAKDEGDESVLGALDKAGLSTSSDVKLGAEGQKAVSGVNQAFLSQLNIKQTTKIDNASTDNTTKVIENNYSDLRVQATKKSNQIIAQRQRREESYEAKKLDQKNEVQKVDFKNEQEKE